MAMPTAGTSAEIHLPAGQVHSAGSGTNDYTWPHHAPQWPMASTPRLIHAA